MHAANKRAGLLALCRYALHTPLNIPGDKQMKQSSQLTVCALISLITR